MTNILKISAVGQYFPDNYTTWIGTNITVTSSWYGPIRTSISQCFKPCMNLSNLGESGLSSTKLLKRLHLFQIIVVLLAYAFMSRTTREIIHFNLCMGMLFWSLEMIWSNSKIKYWLKSGLQMKDLDETTRVGNKNHPRQAESVVDFGTRVTLQANWYSQM